MTPPTLHRLLWGPDSENDTSLADWHIRAWEVPAVGLPVRVATYLFTAAQDASLPSDWDAMQGPLTWQLEDKGDLLSAGRRLQFDFEDMESSTGGCSLQPQVRRSMTWEVPPHAAYYLPFVAEPSQVHGGSYALYCDILLLLTAMDGGETILDRLAENGVGSVPFEDRWAWRSRVHLPMEAWQAIGGRLRWSEQPQEDSILDVNGQSLLDILQPWRPSRLTLDDFICERVDMSLDTTNDAEVVRTVRPPGSPDGDLPPELLLTGETLQENLHVRIGQVKEWLPKKQVVPGFPAMDVAAAGRVMEQVAAAFQSSNHSWPNDAPDIVLLPELAIPQTEVRTVHDLVARTGRASLAGLYWRELVPVYKATGSTLSTKRWFANEAELVIPVGHADRGPTGVRWYRVRKPLPSHIETGLAHELTARSQGVCWSILKGRRWYRFLHPAWGDFTIAICSDLLDTAPWRSLRGELLHAFTVAFNKDVDLYESLTWVRAYENFVNVVMVNHGSFGGSFLWTPRRRHEREIARLRGSDLLLIVDVDVPVKDLLEAQRNGVKRAVDAAVRSWAGSQNLSTEFKAPPPGFARRALAP